MAERMHRMIAEFPARFTAHVHRGLDALARVAPANLPPDVRALIQARAK